MKKNNIFFALVATIAIGATFAYNLELGEQKAFEDEQFEAHKIIEKIGHVQIDEETCQEIYPHKIGANAPCYYSNNYLAIYLNDQYMLHDAKTRKLVMTIKIVDDHYQIEANDEDKEKLYKEFSN